MMADAVPTVCLVYTFTCLRRASGSAPLTLLVDNYVNLAPVDSEKTCSARVWSGPGTMELSPAA